MVLAIVPPSKEFLSARPCGRDLVAGDRCFAVGAVSIRAPVRTRPRALVGAGYPVIVSIRAPVRTRPCASSSPAGTTTSFYPRARADATHASFTRTIPSICFYPRARADATHQTLPNPTRPRRFYPRARADATRSPSTRPRRFRKFLSARPCGRDRGDRNGNGWFCSFLSARPCGRDHRTAAARSQIGAFLSARPCGRDPVDQMAMGAWALRVSIRAPVRTRPRKECWVIDHGYVSIRAPVRTRPPAYRLAVCVWGLFLSARPCGRDLFRFCFCGDPKLFLSARPCGRDPDAQPRILLLRAVSIRAPVRTRPSAGCSRMPPHLRFYPRARADATERAARRSAVHQVSIRAPVRTRLEKEAPHAVSVTVSIRAPVRTRPRTSCRHVAPSPSFYPRARADATSAACWWKTASLGRFYPRARADATRTFRTPETMPAPFLSARPCGRDHDIKREYPGLKEFLSARPCGRDPAWLADPSDRFRFYPRARADATENVDEGERVERVSIRAPVRTRPLAAGAATPGAAVSIRAPVRTRPSR